MYNLVIFIGRLGADPEKRTFDNGTQVHNMRLATWESKYNEAKKEWETTTEWHKVATFQKFFPTLKKGDMVHFVGEARTREYTDKAGTVKYINEYLGHVKSIGKKTEQSGQAETSEILETAQESDLPF